MGASLVRLKRRLRPVVARLRFGWRSLDERLRPSRPWDGRHHPVFANFTPWEGEADGRFMVDFLGARTDPAYRKQWRPNPAGPLRTALPAPHAGYFELVAVLESVVEAAESASYTIVELGAGFGPWLVTAHRAMALTAGRPVRLVGVEMVPEHFAWMLEHLRRNGVDPAAHRLLQAAVSDHDAEGAFVPEDDPYHDFGQQLVHDGGSGNAVRVRTVTLERLLDGISDVDLLHVDVQGEELRVLGTALDILARRVRRVVVATHSRRIHRALSRRMTEAGFEATWSFAGRGRRRTDFGDIRFLDGLQVWTNPRLRRSRSPAGP